MLAKALIVHEHRGKESANSHMHELVHSCVTQWGREGPFYHAFHYKEGTSHPMMRHYYQRGPGCSFATLSLADDSSLWSGWKCCPWWCIAWTASSVTSPQWHLAQDKFYCRISLMQTFMEKMDLLFFYSYTVFKSVGSWLVAGKRHEESPDSYSQVCNLSSQSQRKPWTHREKLKPPPTRLGDWTQAFLLWGSSAALYDWATRTNQVYVTSSRLTIPV